MVSTKSIPVRGFRENEADALLSLMRGLAEFEGYADKFAVTRDDLLRDGLGSAPKFKAFVAPDQTEDGALLGMAVTYEIPWTFDLRPVLVLKELFVAAEHRHRRIGRHLMNRVIEEADRVNASGIQWTVLADNHAAKRFYSGFSAQRDPVWERWIRVMPQNQGAALRRRSTL